mmetsp:Transcript_24483/g.40805  ORF Transcript_24483/g.40805 Transcript_24483/m.40805 type:complete len:118 (-) Transcript_24483:923-1276(-)
MAEEESPFLRKKREFKKEKTFTETVIDKSTNAVNDAFLKAIPSDDVKQLPPEYVYPIGTGIFLLLLCIFVAVFVPGYYSSLRTRFLSPVGTGSSRLCSDVTISNTGTYLATKYGYWE